MIDPVQEFIAHQLHSISNVDAGMLPKKQRGGKSFKWWPYQHHKPSKSFATGSHEDRLIGAIDKSSRYPTRSRQDEVEDLLSKGYRKQEIAYMLGVERHTISRDVKKIRGRLKLCLDKSKK
jgi:DNA invertase Pin-like site-specific DNA recombinase